MTLQSRAAKRKIIAQRFSAGCTQKRGESRRDDTSSRMSIASNLSAIHERIARAAKRAGRNPDDIALMVVSKTQTADTIIEAYKAGQRLFGENRVQEFADKVDALKKLQGVEFHMIGHLQSNKTAKAAEIFHAVDSVDSAKLAQRLDAAAKSAGQDARHSHRNQCRRRSRQERHRSRLAGA